jgi:hypothetical protein
MRSETMLQLDLNPQEVGILQHVLESYLSDLRMEIADTDRMAFRERLKERKAVLMRVLDAIEAVDTAGTVD